jgi:hypothetical protein
MSSSLIQTLKCLYKDFFLEFNLPSINYYTIHDKYTFNPVSENLDFSLHSPAAFFKYKKISGIQINY